jgi:hypothetical protein
MGTILEHATWEGFGHSHCWTMACTWRRWIMQVSTHHDALTTPSRPCWGITDQASIQSLLAAIRTRDDPASVTTALKDCVLQSSARKSYTVALYLSQSIGIRWVYRKTALVYRTFKTFYFSDTSSRRHGACCMPTTATHRASLPGVRLAELSSQKRQRTPTTRTLWGSSV